MLTVRYSALLALLIAPPAALGQPFFDAPWRAYSAGTYENGRFPVALATSDFDGDGDADVVVGHNIFQTSLRLLTNDGIGAYTAGPTLPLQRGTWGIAAADLNGDGHADIVASDTDYNYAGNTVAVFLNNGAGTFGPRQSFAAGTAPTGVEAADLDGDGDLDLAVTNYGFFGQGTTVTLLRNSGSGTFAAPVALSVPDAPYRLEAGDVDGDLDLDLVVAHDRHRLAVLRNAGNGAFGAATLYNVTVVPPFNLMIYPDVTLADVEGDGDLDALYANTNTQAGDAAAAVLFRNNGSGTFTQQQAVPLMTYGPSPVDLETPDLDGDGSPDLLAAGYLGNLDGFMVAMNNGSGQFSPAELYAAGASTFAVAAADANGDGTLDALTLDRAGRLLTVHEGLGDGRFPERPIYGDTHTHQTLDLGDVDGDGDLDAATAHHGAVAAEVTVMLNDGDGAYAERYSTPSARYQFVRLADLSGDGVLDLLFLSGATEPPYDAFTAFGNGDGTFGAVQRIAMNSCGWGEIGAFDLDDDGDLDVVATEELGCIGDPLSARRLYIRLNNGAGTFGPLSVILTEPGPRPIVAGDFDEDGHLDIAVGGARIAVHYGNGDGTFQPYQGFETPGGPRTLIPVDFDEDGHLDLAVGEWGGGSGDAGSFTVLRGRGDGTFDPAVSHPNSGLTDGLAAGDVDGDGDLDFMLSSSTRDAALFLNDGAGHFTPAHHVGVARSSRDVHYTDVTGDGIGDLVAIAQLEIPAGGFSTGVVVVEGLTGAPSAPVAVAVQPVSPPVVIGPGGGGFEYTVTLTNTTDEPQTFQAWTAVTGPLNREPVLGPQTVTLPAGVTITRTLRQQVPGEAPAGTYTYHVRLGMFGGAVMASDGFPFTKEAGTATARVNAEGGWSVSGWGETASASSLLPNGFALSEASPNPSTGRAQLILEVAEAQAVRVEVFDGLGRRVATLHDGPMEAGPHVVAFDGSSLPAGVYVVRVTGEAFSATRRITVVR